MRTVRNDNNSQEDAMNKQINTADIKPAVRSMTPPAPTPTRTSRSMSRRACRAPRIAWVKERGGVEEYEGRDIKPEDNGNVSARTSPRDFPNTPSRCAASAMRRSRSTNSPRRHHHQGDDLRRRAREPRPQAACWSARKPRSPTARASARRSPPSSRRNSCATRSRAAAPSSPPTSTTPNSSR
jgi:hypothetical protein